ncbi:MAG: OsmC family protein [Acidobacteriota bacterium]|nr:OsmC family protein [Blastocatellia bacterium]MDW8239922.1 OsmC family protein [Acidobacteriota bacterium]
MTQQLPYYYDTIVEWTGERKGLLSASNLPTLTVATPPEFQGHEGIWSPEHLYVASVNSCLMTTFLAIAQMSKLEFVKFRSQARGQLDKVEGQGFQITNIVIEPQLTIARESDRERALRILEKAEKHCLISNSIKTTVRVQPDIRVAETQQAA